MMVCCWENVLYINLGGTAEVEFIRLLSLYVIYVKRQGLFLLLFRTAFSYKWIFFWSLLIKKYSLIRKHWAVSSSEMKYTKCTESNCSNKQRPTLTAGNHRRYLTEIIKQSDMREENIWKHKVLKKSKN